VSYVRLLAHIVFSTKNREIILPKDIKDSICDHIREEAQQKSIRLIEVNGHFDHLHCLVSLGSAQSVASVVQAIKGESAHWFNNKSGLNDWGKLIWQDDYFAVSVSESHANQVSAYIQNQEHYHQSMNYYQEIERMAKKYGFELKLDKSVDHSPSAKADGNE
jgi:putative transposase